MLYKWEILCEIYVHFIKSKCSSWNVLKQMRCVADWRPASTIDRAYRL